MVFASTHSTFIRRNKTREKFLFAKLPSIFISIWPRPYEKWRWQNRTSIWKWLILWKFVRPFNGAKRKWYLVFRCSNEVLLQRIIYAGSRPWALVATVAFYCTFFVVVLLTKSVVVLDISAWLALFRASFLLFFFSYKYYNTLFCYFYGRHLCFSTGKRCSFVSNDARRGCDIFKTGGWYG